MIENDEKRGIEEIYMSATTSSNLRVEADRHSDADVIIAAGWNQQRIGGALLRLHTEFDASEKPRLATGTQFVPVGKTTKDQRKMAARQAHAFNMHETGILLGKLKALRDVRMQVSLQLLKWGIVEVEQKSVEIIMWWLQPLCPACNGTKFQVAAGTGRHTGKVCGDCCGTGQQLIPYGQEGRRCANWLDQCVERARSSISSRLRPGGSGWGVEGGRYAGPN